MSAFAIFLTPNIDLTSDYPGATDPEIKHLAAIGAS